MRPKLSGSSMLGARPPKTVTSSTAASLLEFALVMRLELDAEHGLEHGIQAHQLDFLSSIPSAQPTKGLQARLVSS